MADAATHRDPDRTGGDFVEMRDVEKAYRFTRNGRGVRAVDGVSLAIRRGESLGLVGETGCGKSSIARLLVGMIAPDSGHIRIGGSDVTSLDGRALKAMRRRVQLVFQNPHAALDPRMRLGRSLEAPLLAHGLGDAGERQQRIGSKLAEVGLDASFLDRLPGACSGGQLQRIVIARALLLEPEFLVCDEPTSALDATTRAQILNLLADLQRRLSLTLLMISHDLRVVRFMCERIVVMYAGQIVEEAPREALFGAPRHPYTRALLSAALLDRAALLQAVDDWSGATARRAERSDGCRFAPRCPHADARCSAIMPDLETVEGGGTVRCHHWRRTLGEA